MRPTHYKKRFFLAREKSSMFTISASMQELIKELAQIEGQAPSRIVERAVRYFIDYKETKDGFKRSKRCYYKKNKGGKICLATKDKQKNKNKIKKNEDEPNLFNRASYD